MPMELNDFEKIAQQINPDLNPVGVIASICHSYDGLDSLTQADFQDAVAVAADCEKLSPGHLRRCAKNLAQLRRFIIEEERMR